MINVSIEIKAAPELIGVLKSLVEVMPVPVGQALAGALSAPALTPTPNQTQTLPAAPTSIQPSTPDPIQGAMPMGMPPIGTMPQTAPAQVYPGMTPQYQQAPQAPTPVPSAPAVPVAAAPTFTMEQLAVAATQLVDAGRRGELVNLLSAFGVQALTALPKEQYGNFATQLRAMGARI